MKASAMILLLQAKMEAEGDFEVKVPKFEHQHWYGFETAEPKLAYDEEENCFVIEAE